MLFTTLLVVHLLSWSLYLGGMASDVTTKILFEQWRTPALIARMYQKFQFTDVWVTQFQVLALFLSGAGLFVMLEVPVAGNVPLIIGFALFVLSGVLFYARLLPVQGRIEKETAAQAHVAPADHDWSAYAASDRQWTFWANIVVGTSFVAFILEVCAAGQSAVVQSAVTGLG